MEVDGVKKQLDFSSEGTGKSYEPRSGTPPPPPSAREIKRPKKSTPKKDKTVTGAAASDVESRQSK